MYTKPSRIYTDRKNLENYINGADVYNSLLLFYLQDPDLETSEYTVKTPYRTDLIAEEFYGDVGYEPFVILQIKTPINLVTRGRIFKLITKQEIDSILEKIK